MADNTAFGDFKKQCEAVQTLNRLDEEIINLMNEVYCNLSLAQKCKERYQISQTAEKKGLFQCIFIFRLLRKWQCIINWIIYYPKRIICMRAAEKYQKMAREILKLPEYVGACSLIPENMRDCDAISAMCQIIETGRAESWKEL